MIDPGDAGCQGDSQEQMRQIDRVASHLIERPGIQNRESIGSQPADGDRFKRADDQVGEGHGPAGEETHHPGKDCGRVGDFTGRFRHAFRQPTIGEGDRDQCQTTHQEGEHCSQRPPCGQPALHDHQPAHTHDRTEGEREVFRSQHHPAQTERLACRGPHACLPPPAVCRIRGWSATAVAHPHRTGYDPASETGRGERGEFAPGACSPDLGACLPGLLGIKPACGTARHAPARHDEARRTDDGGRPDFSP